MTRAPRADGSAPVRRAPRLLLAAVATAALVLVAPLAASAHVAIEPGRAAPGAERVQLAFAVPTESAKAWTTRVRVTLPTATPFAFASAQQVAGWTSSVTTARLPKPVKFEGGTLTEAPVAVTWTADAGTRLTDGEFQSFTVAAGAVPDVGRLVLPVTQTYSDGTVVRWADPTPASGEEPEHPAPVLYVKDGPPADAAGEATVTPASSTSDTVGIALGGAALVVALVALVLALGGVLRGRRPAR